MQFLFEAFKFIGILFLVLLVFNFIIIVHEWGHFLAARWRGLKIEKFQIWMGKPIWKRTWNGVQYGLGTIPLGGFVQLPQMAPMGAIEGRTSDEPLPPIKPIDKIIVAFAGPLFSLLLAFAFACGVALAGKPVKPEEQVARIGYMKIGDPADKSGGLKAGDVVHEIDGKPIKRFVGLTNSLLWAIAAGASDDIVFRVQRPGESELRTVTVHAPLANQKDYIAWKEDTGWLKKLSSRPPFRRVGIAPAREGRIKTIDPGSPAAEAGMQPGDIITTINGEKAYNPMYVAELASARPNDPINVTVLRNGETKALTIIPRVPAKGANEALTGISEFEELNPDERVYEYPSPITLVADCFRNTFATFRALFEPKSSIGVSQMSGPVGIMNLYYNIFQSPHWWRLVLWFSVVLNVGLAIFNMLPLPVLDGGHITMATLEMIRGKAIGTRIMEAIQVVCVLCLLSFVLFVTFKDVGGIAESEKNEKVEWLPANKPAPAPAPAE